MQDCVMTKYESDSAFSDLTRRPYIPFPFSVYQKWMYLYVNYIYMNLYTLICIGNKRHTHVCTCIV